MPPDPRADLTACDREPIRTPGSIQPHGVLIGLAGPERRIAVASANLDRALGQPVGSMLNRPLFAVAPAIDDLIASRPVVAGRTTALGSVEFEGAQHTAVAHRSGDLTILEIERDAPTPTALVLDGRDDTLARLVSKLQPPSSDDEAYAAVAAAVRGVTGYDRVLVYRFAHDWVGTVVGEDRNERLPSYLGLHFPPSDIPAQARELYRLNRIRQIPDASYAPVPLVADSGLVGLDLGLSVLRSVSPVHLEYMRNMGTAASMSVSVLVDGRLWGLIACHDHAPKIMPLSVRAACDFVAQILSMRISAQLRHEDAADRVSLQAAQARILTRMAEAQGWVAGLAAGEPDVLGVTRAVGAAVVSADTCILFGTTPAEIDVRRIAAWLDGRGGDLVATTTLAADMGDDGNDVGGVAGLLAVSLSRMHDDWLMWFRPEVVRTVTWGGDPRKQAPASPDERISPRRSFAAWAETVRGASQPWTAAEVDAARGLRSAIVDIVLRKAEELAAVSDDLRRSNRELEAFSYSISHDLRAPFRHIVGYAELLAEREKAKLDQKSSHYLANIVDAAETAGKLVDDLLYFAQMGRVRIAPVRIDVNKVIAEVRRSLELDLRGRTVEWQVNDLPAAWGDASLLRQALFNLVSNAVKYTRTKETAVIEIGGWSGETETTYYVRDNGIGFDMAYADKLFQVFQRLNRTEDFEGNGIGLASSGASSTATAGAPGRPAKWGRARPSTSHCRPARRAPPDGQPTSHPSGGRQPERRGADAGSARKVSAGQRGPRGARRRGGARLSLWPRRLARPRPGAAHRGAA